MSKSLHPICQFFYYSEQKNTYNIITRAAYLQEFEKSPGVPDKAKIRAAYTSAWDARKFEIELYWKRATYFWAFLVTAFAGYAAVINSKDFENADPKHPEILFFIVCIGFVISVAWLLVNRGSKVWQTQWENHVLLLEDKIAGPLYKTVFKDSFYSVSRINELVSVFFIFTWLMLAYNYFQRNNLTLLWEGEVHWDIALASFFAIALVWILSFGYGRSSFDSKFQIKFNLLEL